MSDPNQPRNPADKLAETVREAVTKSYEAAKPRIEETKVRSGPQLEAGADRAAAFSEQLSKRAEAKAEEVEAGPQKDYTPAVVNALKAGAALAEAAADAAHWAARKGREWSGAPDELSAGHVDGELDDPEDRPDQP